MHAMLSVPYSVQMRRVRSVLLPSLPPLSHSSFPLKCGVIIAFLGGLYLSPPRLSLLFINDSPFLRDRGAMTAALFCTLPHLNSPHTTEAKGRSFFYGTHSALVLVNFEGAALPLQP